MNAISYLVEKVKKCGVCCCPVDAKQKRESMSLTCGPGAFRDDFLAKRDVEFILPPKPSVTLSTSLVQQSPFSHGKCRNSELDNENELALLCSPGGRKSGKYLVRQVSEDNLRLVHEETEGNHLRRQVLNILRDSVVSM